MVALAGLAAIVNGCVSHRQAADLKPVYEPQKLGVPLTDEEMKQIRSDPLYSNNSTDLMNWFRHRQVMSYTQPRKYSR